MDLDEVEPYIRAAGAALVGLGLFTVVVGGVWMAMGGGRLAVQVAIGGLLGGLAGSMLLLAAPDKVPPGERPPRE